MIRLVVLDLDGTLLNSEKHIAECDREAVDRLVESGVTVTIFTGRNYHSALPYVEELGVNVPVVFQNGALIYDFSSKRVLKSTRLEENVALKLIRSAREEGIFTIVYTDFFDLKDMFIESSYTGPFLRYLASNSWRLVMIDDLTKISENPVEIALIGREEDIKNVISDLENVSIVKGSVLEGESFYEVFGPRCSKGDALDFITEHMGIDSEEIIFIGDGYNDLEIMRKVGIAIAMGNSPDEIKKVADWITATNDECGVAKAIAEFFPSIL